MCRVIRSRRADWWAFGRHKNILWVQFSVVCVVLLGTGLSIKMRALECEPCSWRVWIIIINDRVWQCTLIVNTCSFIIHIVLISDNRQHGSHCSALWWHLSSKPDHSCWFLFLVLFICFVRAQTGTGELLSTMIGRKKRRRESERVRDERIPFNVMLDARIDYNCYRYSADTDIHSEYRYYVRVNVLCLGNALWCAGGIRFMLHDTFSILTIAGLFLSICRFGDN